MHRFHRDRRHPLFDTRDFRLESRCDCLQRWSVSGVAQDLPSSGLEDTSCRGVVAPPVRLEREISGPCRVDVRDNFVDGEITRLAVVGAVRREHPFLDSGGPGDRPVLICRAKCHRDPAALRARWQADLEHERDLLRRHQVAERHHQIATMERTTSGARS